MGSLKMPPKGKSAAMLQELNAEHAPKETEPAEAVSDETNVVALQETTDVAESAASRPRKPHGASEKTVSGSVSPASGDGREARLETALKKAQEDEIAVVTVRVSARLNQYMDEYVARINRLDPKRRYRKQDAIAEAFAAFYADHPLPTLPENDEL